MALTFMIVCHDTAAQRVSPGKYWIPITDKMNNAYSISEPGTFLSQRSIDRKARHGIEIEESDLPVSQVYIDSLSQLGLKITGSSRWLNAVLVESTDTLLLDSLSNLGFVKEFNPRSAFHLGGGISSEVESDSSALAMDYGEAQVQISLLNGNILHFMGFTGNDMLIAVFDAGFFKVDELMAYDHLRQSGKIEGTKDFVFPGGNVYAGSNHGSRVMSTLAARLPGLLTGTAPDASYWLMRSEDTRSEYRIEEVNWLLAAELADSAGVDVINSSLGYSSFSDPEMNYEIDDLDGRTNLVTIAAELAFSKGMLVVNSAGNEGNDAWGKISSPADGVNVLAVGAIDTSGVVAVYSSRGPSADNRVKPDVLAVGYATAVLNESSLVSKGYGTSFAAPQIAGLAACLWQAFPGKTNREILYAIRASSSQYLNPDSSFGYGIPDFNAAFGILSKSDSISNVYKIIAFPNPFTTSLEFRLLNIDSPIRKLDIYDLQGRKVHSMNGQWESGDVIRIERFSHAEKGVYLAILRSGKGDTITRIVKL